MDASWVPGVVIGLISLAGGIVTLVNTRVNEQPKSGAALPPPAPVNKPAIIAAPREQDSMAHVMQKAIDRIEILEKTNAQLSITLAKVQIQLRECVATRRKYEELIGKRFRRTGGTINDD